MVTYRTPAIPPFNRQPEPTIVASYQLFAVLREKTFPMAGTSGASGFRRIMWQQNDCCGQLAPDENLRVGGWIADSVVKRRVMLPSDYGYKMAVAKRSSPGMLYRPKHPRLRVLREDWSCQTGDPVWVAFAIDVHDSQIIVGPIEAVKQHFIQLMQDPDGPEMPRHYLTELARYRLVPMIKAR